MPFGVAAVLTVVGIVMNVRDGSQGDPGGPLLGLGAIIAVATFGVSLIVNAIRQKDRLNR